MPSDRQKKNNTGIDEEEGKASADFLELQISMPGPVDGPDYEQVTRNLALELVRVTEAAAIQSGRWLGKGDKNAADQAAVDAMRKVLKSVSMDGVVVIGEGEKDEAPMLYCGERIGDGRAPVVDIAVDPLDGTTLTAQGRTGAISVIALAERGSLFNPGPCVYMDKLAAGPKVKDVVDIRKSVAENIQAVANKRHSGRMQDVSVVVLNRPRHDNLVKQIRAVGARVMLIDDGDVAAAIATAQDETGIDLLLGIGGTPEGVIAACALKCMGGQFQGVLKPRSEAERQKAIALGYDLDKILEIHHLVSSEEIFFAATGVTGGDLLQGVRYTQEGATTHSMVMRNKTGTVRMIETMHRWGKPGLTNLTKDSLLGTNPNNEPWED